MINQVNHIPFVAKIAFGPFLNKCLKVIFDIEKSRLVELQNLKISDKWTILTFRIAILKQLDD